jgi:hypothetical protein
MANPKLPPPGYNTYTTQKKDGFQRSHKASYVRGQTQLAFEELANVKNWDDFVRICEEQKRKRGW